MTAPTRGSNAPIISAEDHALLMALRRGDEAAFVRLVESLHGSMLRLAMVHVGDRAVAEEVVQEVWLAVLQQLDRFEGRSSLKTWVLRIVSNRAKTRAIRERRTVPFSALAGADPKADEPLVDPDRFLPAGHRWAGHWASPPASWQEVPEELLLSRETMAEVEHGQAQHRPVQRLHQPGERRLIAATQRLEELTFLCGDDWRVAAKGWCGHRLLQDGGVRCQSHRGTSHRLHPPTQLTRVRSMSSALTLPSPLWRDGRTRPDQDNGGSEGRGHREGGDAAGGQPGRPG